MEALWRELTDLADMEGLARIGVADLSSAHDYILETGGPVVASYPRCVTLGISLPDDVVNGLGDMYSQGNAEHYRMFAYDVINNRLELAASKAAGILCRRGFRALPMAKMVKAEGKALTAVFSHKLGAHLAGMGWIGKNCMLITPERGPRVRWASVLTDAPLEPTGQSMEQRCGNCMECVKICPVQAYTGRNFVEGEPREARFDAGKCNDRLNALVAEGKPRVCGLCLYVCPYGRKK